jgi:NitT/TauT family transport system permease protein/taurine transport system permease protein
VRAAISIVAFIAVWELASRLNWPWIGQAPAPSKVLDAWLPLLNDQGYWYSWYQSSRRVLSGFIAAMIIGIPLGLAMATSRVFHDMSFPVFEILRPVPPLAWIPLSILWFGVGDAQNEFIIFLGCFFPILVSTVAGVKGVEPTLVRAARCLGAGERQTLWRVVLRAALPQIITGIRVGLGVGWMALVAAELVGASSGLGFLINDARTVLRTDYVIVGMATIGIVGLLIDRVIRFAARRLLPWSPVVSR